MVNKNAVVISLKFHAGHYSHLVAAYSLLTDIGYSPILYINNRFNNFDTKVLYSKTNRLFLNDYRKSDLVLFMFPSYKNILEMLKFRFFSNAKLIYIFHEPIGSYKDFYNSGFGLINIIKLIFINIINKLIVYLSSCIILPSSFAVCAYEKNIYVIIINLNLFHFFLMTKLLYRFQ